MKENESVSLGLAKALLKEIADNIEGDYRIYASTIRMIILPSLPRGRTVPIDAPAPTVVRFNDGVEPRDTLAPQPHAKIARRKHVKMTAKVVREIKRLLAQREPKISQDQVAEIVDVNSGRVSEVVTGKRTIKYPMGRPEWRWRNNPKRLAIELAKEAK